MILVGLFVTTGCIVQPTFDTSSVEPSGSASGHADSEMVLIPATSLGGTDVAPTHHKPGHTNGGKGKGKGPGKCKPDKGDDGPRPPGRGPGQSDDCGSSGGSSNDDDDDEQASSGDGATSENGTVVAPFWIDAREASVREYGDCVAIGACSPAGSKEGCTAAAGLGDHPVNCVSRAQASAFCAWKQKRLVRDVEWIAAAAGTAGRPFPWGSDAPSSERLNACGAECARSGMYPGGDAFAGPAPRGSFPLGRSPEGVFDLAGNVAEWVDADGGLVRGGSYADVAAEAVGSTAARTVSLAASEPTIGFRCARDR